MVAAYTLLPTSELEQAEELEEARPNHGRWLQSVSSAFDTSCRVCRAHAEALDTAWLAELDRLGAPVFTCFMLLRVGLLSLSMLWGFLLVSPLWFISLVSNERFLPWALQAGLIITIIIILEPLPFVGLMHDARSKVFHVLYCVYLVLGWREICIFLVHEESLGIFVARTWVRDFCFTVAAAAILGCGALGWTIWEGFQRRLWTLYTAFSLILLQFIYHKFRTDDEK